MSSSALRPPVRRKPTPGTPMADVTDALNTATPRHSSTRSRERDVSLGHSSEDSAGVSTERRRRTPETPTTVPRGCTTVGTPPVRQALFHQTNNVPHSAEYLLPDYDYNAHGPRLTVVLDLDETLVCNRKLYLPHAVLRPYARDFLRSLNRQLMEVVVWTASTDDTALPVLRQLDPDGTLIEHVVFRNAHWYTEPHHTKDLRLLGRPLSRCVLVDNAPNCCKLQAHNAVLVEDFTGVEDSRDTSLIGIWRVLEVLAQGVCLRHEAVPAMLQRIADNDEILQHVTVMLPEAASRGLVAKEPATPPGGYTFSTMTSAPPQGAYFRVKRVPIPSNAAS